MDKFKAKLYAEFESNCFKVFGLPGARIREILTFPGEDLFKMYEEAWNFGGAVYMRQTMSFTILTLEAVYHETEIGRYLTDRERVERYESFDIGMDLDAMNAWQEMRVAQLNAKDTMTVPKIHQSM
jgi:hypothetical protein